MLKYTDIYDDVLYSVQDKVSGSFGATYRPKHLQLQSLGA